MNRTPETGFITRPDQRYIVSRRKAILDAGKITLFAALAGCSSGTGGEKTSNFKLPKTYEIPARGGHFTVENGTIKRDGVEFGIFGNNDFSLITKSNVCGTPVSNDERIQELDISKSLGMNLIRFWAFDTITQNGQDFSNLDQILSVAKEKDMVIYPALTNMWGDCEPNNKKKDDAWYWSVIADYNNYKKTHKLDPNGYLAYVAKITEHLKDNPQVFAFQLGNELECDNAKLLQAFTFVSNSIIKERDPGRLVTTGVMGSGQPGAHEGEFESLMKLCDFADIHIFEGIMTHDMLGDGFNGTAVRMKQARDLNIPMVVSEMGVPHGYPYISRFQETIISLLKNRNFVGLAPWGLNTEVYSNKDPYWFDAASPVMRMYRPFIDKLKYPALRPTTT